MRRFLIILLLTLMPLQAAWASVCAYCPDKCISEFAPGSSADDVPSDDIGLDSNDECSRCHLGGAGVASALSAPSFFSPPDQLAPSDGIGFSDAGQSDRPERPKWTRAA